MQGLFVAGVRRSCTFIGIALGAIFVAPFLVLLLDRREPVMLGAIRIEPAGPLSAKQEVTIIWDATERRAGCDGEFERQVIDSTGRVFPFRREPTVYRLTYNPKTQTFTKQFRLPDGLAPGRAIYTSVGARWCNVVQKHLWPIPFRSPDVAIQIK